MTIKEIEKKAAQIKELQDLIEEANQEMETLKDSIKAEMNDTDELHAGIYTITWKEVNTTRLDTAAIRKNLPEIVKAYSKVTTSRRFCVA